MGTLNKVNVKTASAGSCRMDLSTDHLTTQNFMQLQPVYYRHMIPGEKVSINVNAFTRLSPLAVPTYGRARMNLRAFFIPYRLVFPYATEFMEETWAYESRSQSIPTLVPYFTIQDWSTFILSADCATVTTGTTYDLRTTSNKYILTAFGRRCMKIMNSLGYRIPIDTKSLEKISAISLFSFLKVYLDWYTLSQYQHTVDVSALASLLNHYDPSSPAVVVSATFKTIFELVNYVCYDGDLFTAAWDTPFSPSVGDSINRNVSDIDNVETFVTNGLLNAPTMVQNDASDPYLGTTYIHQVLKAMTDLEKRHQLVGARSVDRYLVDWGISLDSAKLQRSVYLGNKSIDVQIGDVMSHADTSGAGLGDYAGRGFSNGNKDFDFETDEFGVLLLCSSILPYSGYFQGMDRQNLHLVRPDFYDKHFDSLGSQAISKMEVYVSRNESFGTIANYKRDFGYASTFYEYKHPLQWVTGDFDTPSMNSGASSWHLFRQFDDSMWPNGVTDVQHSVDFCRGDLDAIQYNRIFTNTDDFDHFFAMYHFGVVSHAPCRSLFDTYDFSGKGKEVTLDANGTKVN